MTDPYYSRKSKADSEVIACGCFVAVIVLGALAVLVQAWRWVVG